VPTATTIGFLVNPELPDAQSVVKDAQSAAGKRVRNVHVVNARTESEIDAAFDELARNRVKALAVASESVFITRRDHIVALAARHAMAACYPFREFAAGGGLMSYGADGDEGARQVALYAARILNGTRPAELPVIQLNRLQLVVNLKTAKKLGLNISRDFLARVDEVIQ
jgi:putative ABC transport system substrate-binding protein